MGVLAGSSSRTPTSSIGTMLAMVAPSPRAPRLAPAPEPLASAQRLSV